MRRRIAISFVAQVFRLAIVFGERFLVVGVLLRAWGTEVYGDWALTLSATSLLSLAELGLNIYYGNVWQKANVEHDAAQFQRTLSIALGGALIQGLVVASLFLGATSIVNIPRLISISTIPGAQAIVILALLGLAAISRMMRGAISQVYRGRQCYARGVMIDAAFLAALIASMFMGGLAGVSPTTMAWFYFAIDLIFGWGLMAFDISRRWPDLSFRPALATRAELRDILQQVRWLAIQQGAPVAWASLPVVIIGAFGATGASFVSFLMLRTLANLARQLASMLSISTGIEIANVHYACRDGDVARQLALLGRFLSAVSAGVFAGIVLYGEPFFAVWSGREGLFDKTIAALMFGAALVTTPSAPIASFAILSGYARAAAVASVIQLAIGLSICAALAYALGIHGATVGLAIGEVIGLGVVLPAITQRYTGLNYVQYYRESLIGMAIVASWSLGVGYAVAWLIGEGHSLTKLLVNGAIWTGFGLLPAILVSLPAPQRARLVAPLWKQIKAWASGVAGVPGPRRQ